jgi:hypothetical protein
MSESKVFPPISSANALFSRRGPNAGTSIIDEIENASDYYGPSVYQLLNFYSSYEPQTDDNTSFIPVTQAKSNPKLFVVGVLPPSVNITGRLLDRSASLGSITGDPEVMDVPEGRDVAVGEEDGVVIPSDSGTKGADLPDTFWHSYVQMCDRLKVDPLEMAAVIEKESHFNPNAQNKGPKSEQPRAVPIAQGLCQFIRTTATSSRIGMDEATWNTFCLLSAEEQLPYVESFYKGRAKGKTKEDLNIITFGGHKNPDGSLYASAEAQASWIAAHPEDAGKFNKPEKQDKATKQNSGAVDDKGRITRETLAKNLQGFPSRSIRERIEAARTYLSQNPPVEPPVESPVETAESVTAWATNEVNSNWASEGSPNATVAKKEQSKTAGLPDTARDRLGRRYQAAQSAEIKQTIQAIDTMRNAPPLRFLVNPSTFSVRTEKIVSDGNWTRNGPIVEHWGENQDKIEASGKVASFFSIDANSPNPDADGGPGLTRGARQYSAGYQNFLSLYLLYRNNANIYSSGQLSMVGSMYIFYDDTLYFGSFDSFNVTESDTAPYTLEYNLEFTVRATFLLDRPATYSREAAAFISSKGGPLPTTNPSQLLEDFSEVPQ